MDRASAFAGTVEWDGLERRVVIQEAFGYHLLGMHLIGDCTITMDVCIDGTVAIEPEICEPFD